MLSRSIAAFAVMLLIAGCGPVVTGPVRTCPPMGSAGEATAVLAERAGRAVPLRANGQCLLRYYVEGKEHRENFAVKLWVNPPGEIYLQGDIAFDATGIVLGSNDEEFWFWIKPKQVSRYWYGKWSQAGGAGEMIINPSLALEAFGMADTGGGRWSLSSENDCDVLTKTNKRGVILKRIHISRCGYLVSEIEYFDDGGDLSARAEFDKYVDVGDGFFVPRMIKMVTAAKDGGQDSARLTLDSVRPVLLNEKQRQRLFVRPQPQGFEHVYQIIDGHRVEQAGR